MANQVTVNRSRALDANGTPISGAKAYFYETGTTSPVTVYADNDLASAHPSPLVADSAGEFAQVFYSGATNLKVVVHDAADVELYTLDPAPVVLGGLGGASQITFVPGDDIAASTVQAAIEAVQANVNNLGNASAKGVTGVDDNAVTGTAGTAGKVGEWNSDGDLVSKVYPQVLGYDEFTDVLTVTAGNAWAQDNTIPQNTEGTAFSVFDLTVTKVHGASDSAVLIEFIAPFGAGTAQFFYGAVFRDSVANALVASGVYANGANDWKDLVVTKRISGLAAGSYDFKVRLCTSTGTAYVNGNSAGTRMFAGTRAAYLKITEIPA